MVTNVDFTFRLLLAMLCGGMIGYERTRQLKSAGIRTHIVVSVAAALIMIVSQYGFQNILGSKGVDLDPSRIAAQIVSGISFIGAGTILTGNTRVSGLTTAAGVWATAAIGMTEGAGMYYIGIASTILIVVIQFIFHDDSLINLIMFKIHIRLSIKALNKHAAIEDIKNTLNKHHVSNLNLQVLSINDQEISLQTDGIMNHNINASQIILDLEQNDSILQVKSERR